MTGSDDRPAKTVTLALDTAGRVVVAGTTTLATSIMLARGTGDDDDVILRRYGGVTLDALDVLSELNDDVSEWSPLPPSTVPQARCPKCPSVMAEWRYRRFSVWPPTGEHLLRICTGCGFRWREQCGSASVEGRDPWLPAKSSPDGTEEFR